MDIFEMLKAIKDNPDKVFETNNGDLVLMDDGVLIFGDGCVFNITTYKLNKMTFTEVNSVIE